MLEEGEVFSADDQPNKLIEMYEPITTSQTRTKRKTKRLKKKKKKKEFVRAAPNNRRITSMVKNGNYNIDELDEYEMLCVRGASPPTKHPPELDESYLSNINYFDRPSFYTDIDESQEYVRMTRKEQRKMRQKNDLRYRTNNNGRSSSSSNNNNNQCRSTSNDSLFPVTQQKIGNDKDAICTAHIFQKCRINPCDKIHAMRHVRHHDLCHFFYKNQCTKGRSCQFLHNEFPCTYYYLGVKSHDQTKCNLMHGPPLTNKWRETLLEHMMTTVKFGSIERQKLHNQMEQQHQRLLKIYGGLKTTTTVENVGRDDFKGIRNLAGILMDWQIESLTLKGIVNIDQISQLTVIELNQIGLTPQQIHDVQMNALNIEKVEKVFRGETILSSTFTTSTVSSLSPMECNNEMINEYSQLKARNSFRSDVDMRVQHIPQPIIGCTNKIITPLCPIMTTLDSNEIQAQTSLTGRNLENSTSDDDDELEPRLVINEEDIALPSDDLENIANRSDFTEINRSDTDNQDPSSPPFLGF